jgi:hypothetical protein
MATTFDATLKDMGRESPNGFLTAFDRPPELPTRLLNVDLSTVTSSADLAIGLGDPLVEIIHLDFQSSAAAWKHADVMTYNALLFAHYHCPVHSIILLLRVQAAHKNMNGVISYAPRPERGSMNFSYEVIRLWERPVEELLSADIGVLPLAVLGRLPAGISLEDGLALVAQRVADRLQRESTADMANKLLTDTYLLTGLRVRRAIAKKIFRGVRVMEESDTYLAIIDEGREKEAKKGISRLGKRRFGPPEKDIELALEAITDLDRLERVLDRILDATNWQDLLDTP